jgi:DNA (cytosine-5)-methyltransferase 1
MKLLDLFCGAGGAAMGYHRAGFEVVGVDITKQWHYPFEFHKGDALEFLKEHRNEFAVIHASPPCQRWTQGNAAGDQARRHPDLLTPTRTLLKRYGTPYVIENVYRAPMPEPIILCGTMFDLTAVDDDGTVLHLKRHRKFESSEFLYLPRPCYHPRGVQWAGAYGGARRDKREARDVRRGGYVPPSLDVLQRLIGIDWADERGLFQAIPPAYTEFIGRQLIAHLEAAA